jgi:hypothetical protein
MQSDDEDLDLDLDDDSDEDHDEEEEQKQRKALIDKIKAYKTNFPEIFEKNKSIKNLKKKDGMPRTYTDSTPIETIEADLDEIKRSVASENGIKDCGNLAVGISVCIQSLGGMVGLNLRGPKTSLASGVEHWKATIDCAMREMIVKYDMNSYCEPEYRLLLAFGGLTMSTHMENSSEIARLVAEKQRQPAGAVVDIHEPENRAQV